MGCTKLQQKNRSVMALSLAGQAYEKVPVMANGPCEIISHFQ